MGFRPVKGTAGRVAHAFRYYLPAREASADDIRTNFDAKTANRLFRTDLGCERPLGSSADGKGEKGIDRSFERTGTPMYLGE